jgi:hypothetical protein
VHAHAAWAGGQAWGQVEWARSRDCRGFMEATSVGATRVVAPQAPQPGIRQSGDLPSACVRVRPRPTYLPVRVARGAVVPIRRSPIRKVSIALRQIVRCTSGTNPLVTALADTGQAWPPTEPASRGRCGG